MLASIFSLNVIQTALELGCIYALVALALFLNPLFRFCILYLPQSIKNQ